MPRYQQANKELAPLAQTILERYTTHKPVLEAQVTIDFLFAYGEKDEATGIVIAPAIKLNGVSVAGLCRVVNEKDRIKGNADIEIQIDGDWWDSHDEPERLALLDHELHHIVPVIKNGRVKLDQADRPKVKMRDHDYDFGWFRIIAERHRKASRECTQAAQMMEESGQLLWPDIFNVTGEPAPAAPAKKRSRSAK